MFKRPSDVASFFAVVIAFGGLATTQAFHADLTQLFGAVAAPKILAAIDLLSGVAGVAAVALRIQSNPSPPPGQASVVTPVAPGVATVTVPQLGTPNK